MKNKIIWCKIYILKNSAYRGYKVRCKYGDELMERFQENSTLQRKYGRPQYPQDPTQEVLSSPSAATLDEKTKNSIRRRRQEMVAFAAQVGQIKQCLVLLTISYSNSSFWWTIPFGGGLRQYLLLIMCMSDYQIKPGESSDIASL